LSEILCIISHTQIRFFSFNIKILENGGISILFNNPKEKAFAEKIIYEKLDKSKKTWIFTNKVYLRGCHQSATDVDQKLLSKALNSANSVKLGQKKVIFSLQTKEQAVQLINDGYLF
jgi:hypothetical protein